MMSIKGTPKGASVRAARVESKTERKPRDMTPRWWRELSETHNGQVYASETLDRRYVPAEDNRTDSYHLRCRIEGYLIDRKRGYAELATHSRDLLIGTMAKLRRPGDRLDRTTISAVGAGHLIVVEILETNPPCAVRFICMPVTQILRLEPGWESAPALERFKAIEEGRLDPLKPWGTVPDATSKS